jgi:hypothetical protein
VGQGLARTGIHPLRTSPQGFLDHCTPDTAIGPGHENCLVCDFHYPSLCGKDAGMPTPIRLIVIVARTNSIFIALASWIGHATMTIEEGEKMRSDGGNWSRPSNSQDAAFEMARAACTEDVVEVWTLEI